MASMLQPGGVLIEPVIDAREGKLREMIREFQNESDAANAQHQWKQIETEVFGVEYDD